ncbi:MAG: hypothetical protein D6731_03930 [Planctomycetota bacterium]|nr:MAG: hypothetical protein D6731_03930 [Planctomycetota bacterium]
MIDRLRFRLAFAAASFALLFAAGCRIVPGGALEPSEALQPVSHGSELLAVAFLVAFVTVPLDLMLLCVTHHDPFPITRAVFCACR